MLRIRVELIPGGYFDAAETLDEVFITNDGTGTCGGPDEGGVGNYDVTREPFYLYPQDVRADNALGRIEGIPRIPHHRLDLAIRALQMLRRGNKPRRAGL